MGSYLGLLYDYICADDPVPHSTEVEVETTTDIHCCTNTTVYETDDETPNIRK